MRILIFFLCYLLYAIVTVILENNGVRFGLIPTIILFSLFGALAGALCRIWARHKANKDQETDCVPDSQKADAVQPGDAADSTVESMPEKTIYMHENESIDECGYKKRFCSQCGSLIDPVTKQCSGCGKQYFKGIHLSRKTYCVIVLALLMIVSIICNFIQLNNAKQQNDVITTLSNRTANLDKQIQELRSENGNLKSMKRFIDEYVVFIEDNGTKLYHTYDCTRFQKKYFWIYNIDQAKNLGFTECPTCH